MIINRIINNTHILAHVFNIITIISRKNAPIENIFFSQIPYFRHTYFFFIHQPGRQISCSLHRNLFGGHIAANNFISFSESGMYTTK